MSASIVQFPGRGRPGTGGPTGNAVRTAVTPDAPRHAAHCQPAQRSPAASMPKTKIPAEVALGLKLRKISNEMLAYVANYPDCAYGRKAYGVIRDIEDRMPRRKVK